MSKRGPVRHVRRARLLLTALGAAALLVLSAGAAWAADLGSPRQPGPSSSTSPSGTAPLAPGAYAAAVLADSPGAYWPLATPERAVSGDDASGHGNQLSFVGVTPRTVRGPAMAGDVTAAQFDGLEASVEATRSPLTTAAHWSIEAWVSLGTLAQRTVIFSNGVPDRGEGYALGIGGPRGGSGSSLVGLVGTRVVDSGYTFTTIRRWHYVVMTRDASTIRFSVDGRPTAKVSTAPVPAPAPRLAVGGAVAPGGTLTAGFHGMVAQVAVYPTALTSGRVLAHYRSTYQGQADAAVVTRPATSPRSPATSPRPPATARPRAQSDIPASGPVMVAPNFEYGLALSSSGTVWEWGNAPDRARAGGENMDADPDQGLPSVTGIAAGGGDLLAIAGDGTVRAQGVNQSGQLGNGTTTDSTTPVTVSNLTDVTAVATSADSSFALESNGTVWGWGNNWSCTLGNSGTLGAVTRPVQTSNLSSVTAIANHDTATLAVKADGTVWGWGSGFDVQLGLDFSHECVPTQVPGLAGVTAVAVGDSFSYALESDGSVWTWGLGPCNDKPPSAQVVSPATQVPMPEPMVAIAAGDCHVLALGTDGTVWAWYDNTFGQLGNGTTTQSPTPVAVPGLSGVRSISASGDQSFAIENDGSVWAWGLNYVGALGDGTDTDRHSPVRVLVPPPLQVILAPSTQSGPAGTPQTLIASVVDASGDPAANVLVGFDVLQGPDIGGASTTGSDGTASFAIPGVEGGVDSIQANVLDGLYLLHWSNPVSMLFTPPPGPATQVVFVHGWHSSALDIVNGTAYTALVQGMQNAGATVVPFTYYQDLAYRQADGSCDPAMPDADQNTGPLPVQPNGLSTTVCDSESDLAYDAAMLDDQLFQYSTPVSLVSDSLGGAVVRGWLALAQLRGDTHSVSDVIFHHGVQQGVYFLNSYVDANNGAFAPLVDYLVRNVAARQGYDITRPAGHDIVPQSDWISEVNSLPLPPQLHYYNFYTDIRVHVTQYCVYWQCGDLGTLDAGDAVLLPGNPDPAATPRTGGAEFLPGLQPAPDRRQFVTSQTIEAASSGGTDLDGALIFAGSEVMKSPLEHVNAGAHAGDGQVKVDSCTGAGQVNVLDKIDYIIANPASGCS